MTGVPEAFCDGAEQRIRRFMLAVFAPVAGALWYGWGAEAGLGFLIGCGVAFVNLVWLKQITATFVDRLSGGGAPVSGWGLAFRFVLRYALIALLAYGMLANRPASVGFFLAGLFLPVAAFFCEAVYECYAALRRGL